MTAIAADKPPMLQQIKKLVGRRTLRGQSDGSLFRRNTIFATRTARPTRQTTAPTGKKPISSAKTTIPSVKMTIKYRKTTIAFHLTTIKVRLNARNSTQKGVFHPRFDSQKAISASARRRQSIRNPLYNINLILTSGTILRRRETSSNSGDTPASDHSLCAKGAAVLK